MGISFSFNKTLILFFFNRICLLFMGCLINHDIQLFLCIQLKLSMNLSLPIRKLIPDLIYFYLQFAVWCIVFFFDGVKEANLYEIKSWRLRSQNVFIDIDIDDVRNLEDLLRVVLIDEEFGNLKVVGRVY